MRRETPELFALNSRDVLPANPEVVCAALEPLLTEERKRRIAEVIAARSHAVAPVLDGLIDPHNVAAVLRSAEAFGVQTVHLVANTEPFFASQKIAQGTQRWLDVVEHPSPEACFQALRAHDYRVYVAAMDGEITPEALAEEKRVAIVFGNEHAGVSAEMRELADGAYTIPMRGFVQSLNVSVAAALTLRAAMRGRPGDLTAEEKLVLRARYVLASVPNAHAILEEQLRRSVS
ncbi:MAG TPA: RNA methyltransferase [Polyangiales bacterium]|jgi:tRNA (guanosine-2'-O-)-methyltransferase|nr:RNA methyltransferase [Polyangiales bacterium]